ncbi:MAG: carbon-nitrogen hydrolase family protein [Opitutaceae bacterium]|nr:carbon-nitrogen hydrolase family protein [Opitutaceae bacterium]
MLPIRIVVLLLGLVAAPGAVRGAEAASLRVKVAAISFVPEKGNLTANADRLEAAFREAAGSGARLAVAPEGILEGYVINPMLAAEMPVARMHELALPLDAPLIQRFRNLSRDLQLCVVFGFAEKVGRDVFNTAVFIDHTGEIRGKYHKMQFEEGYHPSWWFNRLGERSRTFDTPFGRCGILICNDRWTPALARIPALDGAQFLVIPAYGSTSARQDDAVIARARETGLPVIEANVGVSLVVDNGAVAAVRRAPTAVTLAEITVPPPIAARPEERDAVEREFLAWRATEMAQRYEKKRHRLPPEAVTAASR